MRMCVRPRFREMNLLRVPLSLCLHAMRCGRRWCCAPSCCGFLLMTWNVRPPCVRACRSQSMRCSLRRAKCSCVNWSCWFCRRVRSWILIWCFVSLAFCISLHDQGSQRMPARLRCCVQDIAQRVIRGRCCTRRNWRSRRFAAITHALMNASACAHTLRFESAQQRGAQGK
jgi:hypothetical protein